jgi:hypothetical protein
VNHREEQQPNCKKCNNDKHKYLKICENKSLYKIQKEGVN